MKLGTMQYLLEADAASCFAKAADAGFECVGLDWFEPEVAATGDLAPEKREALRKASADASVAISCVAPHFLNGGGLASADEATRTAGFAATRTGLQLCKELGAPVLLLPFFADAELDDDASRERLVAALRELAPEAEAAGVTLAVESTLPAADLVSLLESKAIGVYWDMGNAMCFGYDPVEEVRVLGSLIAQAHAKEFVGPDTWSAKGSYPGLNGKPLGEGEVPVAAVLGALKETGYTGDLLLETGPFSDGPTAAKAALKVLRAAL